MLPASHFSSYSIFIHASTCILQRNKSFLSE